MPVPVDVDFALYGFLNVYERCHDADSLKSLLSQETRLKLSLSALSNIELPEPKRILIIHDECDESLLIRAERFRGRSRDIAVKSGKADHLELAKPAVS